MTDTGLLILRVFAGLFMAFGHGFGKFNRFFSGDEIKFLDFLGIGMKASLFLAMSAEFFFALFIVVGLFTRASSVFLIITMFVAAFVAHWGDPFGKMELSLLYLTIFTTLFFTGGGKYSVSNLFSSRFENGNKILSFLTK